jgi:hypothetical protein
VSFAIKGRACYDWKQQTSQPAVTMGVYLYYGTTYNTIHNLSQPTRSRDFIYSGTAYYYTLHNLCSFRIPKVFVFSIQCTVGTSSGIATGTLVHIYMLHMKPMEYERQGTWIYFMTTRWYKEKV